jgi:ubiquinone biosynthesis protein
MTPSSPSLPEESTALSRFLEILPQDLELKLFALMSGGPVDAASIESELGKVDWQTHRGVVEDLLREYLPIGELVPDIYEKWRPVVRDGFAFIGARLSPERLVPKLVEQLSLPDTAAVEDRILAFVKRTPTLQKIGQIVARNESLDAEFRKRLTVLEDGIHEVDEQEIRQEIENQLSARLAEQEVELQPGLYAEGSVSALMRFTRAASSDVLPAAGVFKVLKPFITKYFQEDLDLLAELGDYFEANQKNYELEQLNLRDIVDNVRELFERETDFVHERVSMQAAARRYAGVPGIRIPQPIDALSTSTITAMTEERSVKITDAFAGDPQRRRELAQRLVECLVARPIFSSEELSPFHADPHAGNIRIDESNGDIVLLDWALTDSLTTEDRRCLILLFVALPLRDEGQVLAALSELSLPATEGGVDLLKRQIESFIDALPLGSIPGTGSLTNLVGRLLRAGARFSGSFLIFRKMLSTLGDVVEQISPGITVEQVVVEYALARGFKNNCAPGARKTEFTNPLRASDVARIVLSAQSFLPRIWLQSWRSIARNVGILPRPGSQTGMEQH